MSQYVVIGTSPFVDTSVAAGPFRSTERIRQAEDELAYRGYATETCELLDPREIGYATNEED